ncbi:uncharacterized protein C19orf44 homolog isoform X2 [Triplophysa dalaica]|nr:uncharacterized protein C19orf44 homolog isoform X2 [Triplophysa dalaica]
MGGGSRYLKKTARNATREGPLGTPAGTDTLMFKAQRISQSAALSRLSLIENRFRNTKVKGDGPGVQTEPQDAHLSLQSSSDLSMTGSRFLKKKIPSEPQEQLVPQKTQLNAFTRGVMERKGRTFSPDSDEQDMQRLLGDSFSLSEDTVQKPASPQLVNKLYRKSSKTSIIPSPTSDGHDRHIQPSPSPKSSSRPVSHRVVFAEQSVSSESDHSEIRSLDDLFPVAAASDLDDTVSERSAASDDFKLHIMSLDDLAPVLSEVSEILPDKIETKAKTEDNIKKSPNNVSMVGSSPAPEQISAAYESDFESEIPFEEPLSASEISEHLTDEDGDVVSEAQDSSCKSQDEDVTLSGSSRSSSRHRVSYSGSSSQTGSDETVTQCPSPDRQVKDAAVQTQTDGLTWSSGMAATGPSLGMTYVDPIPIASHTVSAEAIESLTSYSPAMLALNDMLRQQLALSGAFIESTRRHYTSVLESLGPANYKYTTLEDTKEFIRTHRPPKLSIEEALQEVLKEMRDYHYN